PAVHLRGNIGLGQASAASSDKQPSTSKQPRNPPCRAYCRELTRGSQHNRKGWRNTVPFCYPLLAEHSERNAVEKERWKRPRDIQLLEAFLEKRSKADSECSGVVTS